MMILDKILDALREYYKTTGHEFNGSLYIEPSDLREIKSTINTPYTIEKEGSYLYGYKVYPATDEDLGRMVMEFTGWISSDPELLEFIEDVKMRELIYR